MPYLLTARSLDRRPQTVRVAAVYTLCILPGLDRQVNQTSFTNEVRFGR